MRERILRMKHVYELHQINQLNSLDEKLNALIRISKVVFDKN